LGIRRNLDRVFEAMKPVRRRIEFDAETWHALNRLALEKGKKRQDLANDAFRDLLKKHRRPVTLREALEESVRMHPANDKPKAKVYRLRSGS
jgi:hypothetical protein